MYNQITNAMDISRFHLAELLNLHLDVVNPAAKAYNGPLAYELVKVVMSAPRLEG